MYRCAQCRKQWYSQRKTTGAYHHQVDEIADAVVANGHHDVPTVFLINGTWSLDTFDDEARAWCEPHGFTFRQIRGWFDGERTDLTRFRLGDGHTI